MADAVKVLLVTMFFLGSSAQSVLLVWICKTVAVVKFSRSCELPENRAFVSRQNACFVACAVMSLMRDVACAVEYQFVYFLLCFLEQLVCVMSAELRYSCVNNLSLSWCVHAMSALV